MLIAGGKPYNNQQFKDHMNRHYYPLSAMQKSVEAATRAAKLEALLEAAPSKLGAGSTFPEG